MNLRKASVFFSVALLFLSGCASFTSTEDRTQEIKTKAEKAGFKARIIPKRSGHKFSLLTFSKIRDPERKTATIYLEGDGFAWVTRRQISQDPTPHNPVAFNLSLLDQGPNVIYIARPCQYLIGQNRQSCDNKYWTSHRYAPEIVQSISAALDDYKAYHKFESFELIGYSGGGTLAALLPRYRNDIKSIRSVAGNLDIAAFTNHHKVSALHGSFNPVDDLSNLSQIPQIHFSGVQDDVIPYTITREAVSKMNREAGCDIAKTRLVEGVSHGKGWEGAWPNLNDASVGELKKIESACSAIHEKI